MNYEEKYNEILEWARKNKARLNGVPIEEVLPELAESEDERIRRTLVEYFGPSAQLDFIRGVPIKKIRDWLEKQKLGEIPPYVTGIKGDPDPAGVWKPSEEQMKALLNTLHPDDPYYHDLKSLYEQLKKL